MTKFDDGSELHARVMGSITAAEPSIAVNEWPGGSHATRQTALKSDDKESTHTLGTPASNAVKALADKLGGGVTTDAICIAAVMQQPFAPLVLSGAVTPSQVTDNAAALRLTLTTEDLAALMKACVMDPEVYWMDRKALAWN